MRSTQGFVAALLNELKPLVASDSTSSMRWEGTEDCFLPLLVCALFVGAGFGRRKTPACRHYLAACKTPVPVPRSVGTWYILISPPPNVASLSPDSVSTWFPQLGMPAVPRKPGSAVPEPRGAGQRHVERSWYNTTVLKLTTSKK